MADEPTNILPKQRGRPFEKGRSGNPTGRLPGTRCKATIMAEKLVGENAEEIVKATIQAAKAGDATAMGLLMKHILPVRKGRPILLPLPAITVVADVPAAIGAVAAAVADGLISPEEGLDIAGIIEASRKAIETVDLARRVAALEGGDDGSV